MIDNDEEYKALKKLCRNEIYQFEQKSGYDTTKWKDAPEFVKCPHWVFSEDYALKQKPFKLYWHTHGVIDGGVYVTAELKDDLRLVIGSHKDGICYMGCLDHKELQLDRYSNRMISINVNTEVTCNSHEYGSALIQISYFNDPEYKLWTVKYFDYIAKMDAFVTVRARSENEAKVVAWYHSPWHTCQDENKPIDPQVFEVFEYTGPQIQTRKGYAELGQPDLSDAVLATQMALCEHYDINHI